MNEWIAIKNGTTTTVYQETADKVSVYVFTDCRAEDDDYHTCSIVLNKSELYMGVLEQLWESAKKGELTADKMYTIAGKKAMYDVTYSFMILSTLEEIGALEAYDALGNELEDLED